MLTQFPFCNYDITYRKFPYKTIIVVVAKWQVQMKYVILLAHISLLFIR